MADNPSDPDALQRDIDRTRDELARTIDEIVDRVHPKRVVQRRAELFRENAQHYRETVGARMSLDGRRGVRELRPSALRALSRGEGSPRHAASDREGHLGTTTYAVQRAKVPLIVGAGAVLVVTTVVVVWRLRRR